jgi:CzcA family heavy metal efflux pump
MLSLLVRFSLRFAPLVIILTLLLLGYGSYRFVRAGLDIFPEFSPKQVIIQTESPGLSAEQVEVLVTQAIETSLNGLIGLKLLRSESIQGLSVVTAIFNDNTNILTNRQQVTERLATISSQLPSGVNPPVLVPMSSSSATVMTVGVTSRQKDLMALRDLVDWTLVPRIMSVPGVADVNVFGGEIRQLQIQLDPLKLLRYQLSVTEVLEAARASGQLGSGGGIIETVNQRFSLNVTQTTQTPEQLGQLIVKRQQGSNIVLADIAEIGYAPKPAFGAAQIMGETGIVMMVIGQYGANTLSVSQRLEQVLAEFEPLFEKQGIRFYPHLFRPADYIESSFANLSTHLMMGAGFVLLILFLFLYDIRVALISALAIPASLLGAVLVLLEAGINLNVMVLGGLAIVLGEVVDDAIIDSENIFRRLRENHLLAHPLPASQVVLNASLEVRSSVVYASFIVALVFVPLLTLEGVAGRLFAPLGFAYIAAILTSLLIALTLTPALSFLVLGKAKLGSEEPLLIRWIKSVHRFVVDKIHNYFSYCFIGLIIIGLSCFYSLTRVEHKFLPELREGHYMVHTSSIPGTSLAQSIALGKQLTRQFLKIDGVQSVSQWAGRAARGADTYGTHYSEYEVRLKPMSGTQQQQVFQQLREILEDFPGIVSETNTFLTERIDETISGYTAPVVVNIYGNDLNDLDVKARQLADIMKSIAGADNIQLRSPASMPKIQIEINESRLAQYGLNPGQIQQVIDTAYQGQIVGQQMRGNRLIDISLTFPGELRQSPESIRQLPIKTLDGQVITLGQVVNIRHTDGRYNILHQNAQRKQTVTCTVINRDMDDFMTELKQRVLSEMTFSANSYPQFTGAAMAQTRARHNLILYSVLAGTMVLLLIYLAMGNVRNMLLTLFNLPFALLGGALAVLLTGASLSVGSVVGFITLFGITVRNSIMLISHYQNLVAREGYSWNWQTVLHGVTQRLPSILMTALVTALAMFPIAFNSDNPGLEIMGPMAAIIIGGLVSSTFLNLLLMPTILLRYGHFGKKV